MPLYENAIAVANASIDQNESSLVTKLDQLYKSSSIVQSKLNAWFRSECHHSYNGRYERLVLMLVAIEDHDLRDIACDVLVHASSIGLGRATCVLASRLIDDPAENQSPGTNAEGSDGAS